MRKRVKKIENDILAGLMIDIDNFKTINDTYGHATGDDALRASSDILQKTFRRNDFIARYGGDEFVVAMALEKKDHLHKAIDRLKENIRQFNAKNAAPYTISMSVGYDCFFDQSDQTATDFIRHIDNLMYRQKQDGGD